MSSADYRAPLSAYYTRPQWTGKPMVYSDGKVDTEWSECPSCLGYHHAKSRHCNGKREPALTQCPHALGEIRCHRPEGHLGEHEAKSAVMRIEWERLDG